MRKLMILLAAALVALPATLLWAAGRGDCTARLTDLPREELSEQETAALLQMRQEEKLARDVYLVLAEQHDLPVFANIARAEQRHMDAVGGLLQRYDLKDPLGEDAVGVFADPGIADLYRTLTAVGEKSLNDALMVGAEIEDLDLKDLRDAQSAADNEDIAMVFGNLARGSRNHLRAFAGQLATRGQTYEAQHISATEFAAILAADHEPGRHAGGKGAGRSSGGDCAAGSGRGHGRGQGRGGCRG